MVDLIDAYKIINKAVLQVANDIVLLDQLEYEEKPYQVRLEETPFSIAERRNRLDGIVVVGHDLSEYTNRFYSITLEQSEIAMLDYLINIRHEDIDLTEFGEYV